MLYLYLDLAVCQQRERKRGRTVSLRALESSESIYEEWPGNKILVMERHVS